VGALNKVPAARQVARNAAIFDLIMGEFILCGSNRLTKLAPMLASCDDLHDHTGICRVSNQLSNDTRDECRGAYGRLFIFRPTAPFKPSPFFLSK
jgi:hypothetical protein